MKSLLHKLNYQLLVKPCLNFVVLLLYVLALRVTNVAYCSWITDEIFWTFPLEQDVAEQYWQDSPSDEIQERRQLQYQAYEQHLERLRILEQENFRARQLEEALRAKQTEMLGAQLEAKTTISLAPRSKADAVFCNSLQNLTMEQKAEAIDKDIYQRILTMYNNTPKDKRDLQATVYKVISEHPSFGFWIARSEADIYNVNGLIHQMIMYNADTMKDCTNNVTKNVLAHINTHFNIFNAENVLKKDPDFNTDVNFFTDKATYQQFYVQNRNC